MRWMQRIGQVAHEEAGGPRLPLPAPPVRGLPPDTRIPTLRTAVVHPVNPECNSTCICSTPQLARPSATPPQTQPHPTPRTAVVHADAAAQHGQDAANLGQLAVLLCMELGAVRSEGQKSVNVLTVHQRLTGCCNRNLGQAVAVMFAWSGGQAALLCCSGKRFAGAPLLARRCWGVAAGVPLLGRYGQQPPISPDRRLKATQGMRSVPHNQHQHRAAGKTAARQPPLTRQADRDASTPLTRQAVDGGGEDAVHQLLFVVLVQVQALHLQYICAFVQDATLRPALQASYCWKTAVACTAAEKPAACAAPRLSMRCLGCTADGAWCASASHCPFIPRNPFIQPETAAEACPVRRGLTLLLAGVRHGATASAGDTPPLIQTATKLQSNCSQCLPGAPAPRTAPSFPGNPSISLQLQQRIETKSGACLVRQRLALLLAEVEHDAGVVVAGRHHAHNLQDIALLLRCAARMSTSHSEPHKPQAGSKSPTPCADVEGARSPPAWRSQNKTTKRCRARESKPHKSEQHKPQAGSKSPPCTDVEAARSPPGLSCGGCRGAEGRQAKPAGMPRRCSLCTLLCRPRNTADANPRMILKQT